MQHKHYCVRLLRNIIYISATVATATEHNHKHTYDLNLIYNLSQLVVFSLPASILTVSSCIEIQTFRVLSGLLIILIAQVFVATI